MAALATYEFADKRGKHVEREFPMGKAPAYLRIGGRTYRRCPPRLAGARAIDYGHTMHNIGPDEAKDLARRGLADLDSRGLAWVSSKQKVKEIEAVTGLVYAR